MVYKVITGANHPGLNCFEPQTAVGVLTTSFSSQDIRALESSEGHGKSLIKRGGNNEHKLMISSKPSNYTTGKS